MSLKSKDSAENGDISLDEVHSIIRSNFELHCTCILTGALERLSKETPDLLANTYYERYCECSRSHETGQHHSSNNSSGNSIGNDLRTCVSKVIST